MHLPLRAAIFALLLGLGGGCTCDPTGFETQLYACAGDADCLGGFHCAGEVCVADGAGGGRGGGSGGTGGGAAGGGDGGQPSPCVLDAGTPCYLNGLGSPQLRYGWDGTAGCAVGHVVCGPTGDVCADQHVPGQEYCDGLDTTCTGVPDPLTCGCNQGLPCYQGRPFTIGANPAGRSRCQPGHWDCTVASGQDQCVGERLPIHELCNGLDDDCDGVVDNGPEVPSCGQGVCAAATQACGVDGGLVPCDRVALAAAGKLPGYAPSELCGDGLDNDCNGLVDEGCLCRPDAGAASCWAGPSSACPADAGCLGLCRRGAQSCVVLDGGGAGLGACEGEVLPVAETTDGLCTDRLDNDCNAMIDCEDLSCDGHGCGANGLGCAGGVCACSGNGGAPQALGQETICDDGKDNDCNGLVDCQEPACASQTCGPNGRVCAANGGTSCACAGGGGVPQALESTCNDGADNDCNGLVDCADTLACASRACVGGGTCDGGVCVPPRDAGPGCVPTQTRETGCADALDNDCDGLVDCADPDCNQQRCGGSSPTALCCGATGPNLGHCSDVSQDPSNCGVCGLSCGTGLCVPVANPSLVSGRCSCTADTQCPRPAGNTFNRQVCRTDAGLCSCEGRTSECGSSSAPDGGRATSCASSYCTYR